MEADTLEEQLLVYAKEGSCSHIQRLLQLRIDQSSSFNINCRSRSKASSGWTPLHLACYSGHRDVVEELLKAGADVNVQNNMGDTPLHKSAYTGRKEIVLLLLRYDACANIINGTAQIPKDVTDDDEIITMLEAAERREGRRRQERLLDASREGDISTLSKLLSGKEAVDIDCRDSVGNTPLHCAAYRGQKQCIIKLLKSGANPSIKNNNEQTALDLVRTDELKQILAAYQNKDVSNGVQKIEGPLWKSSRFLGWRSHWVVLEDGTLSWYPRQADAQAGVRKQGCKSLTQAYCMVKPWDHCVFMLRCFDDTVLYFKVSSKTDSMATRKRWLDAFEAHSSYSTYHCTQQHITDDGDSGTAVGSLTQVLQAASACQLKLESEVSIFLSMVKNEENNVLAAPLLLKAKETSELSSETCAALHLCLELLTKHEEVWSLKLEQEVEKNKALTEALQTLATEHHELKQSLCKSRRLSTLSTLTEDDFYDALSDEEGKWKEMLSTHLAVLIHTAAHFESESELSVSGFLSVASHSCEEDEGRDTPLRSSLRHTNALRGPTGMSGEGNHSNQPAQHNGVKKHRTSLPAPMFSRNDVSIWSILKKCIGMELSKIAMPVVFNEPLSFLQRLTEYMEHTYLIHQANATTDSVERMKCVAAFAVSAVASQWERTGKPFNPLLGETYELIRDDLGFRWVSEQVSHHPPVSAFHAQGLKEDFVFHGSIYPKLKFWGKSIEAEPKGIITLELPKYNEAYTWTNPTCCVHNIIVGQLWIEQYGTVEVINHKTGERCNMTFKPCGIFGKELHKVEGYILDKSKKKLCAMYGKWTECLYTVDPATFDAHKKSDRKNSEDKKGKRSSVDEEPEEMPPPDAETVQVIPGSELIWKITPRPDNSAKFYAFSSFAMQLNELEKSMEGVIPPTDSRLRPDISAMENGDIDLASAEKKRLEEKQRMARKNRNKSTEEWKNRWFQQGPNPYTKAQDWIYLKGYWDRNYTQLPDIY
ncbi:oxysterol-binding protein-related protein 1-like isoform X3 [Thunnus maccoyii]|nr:oxysterol-binding protein-related protein 1-like isoform X3 [Thunnus maccoyii]XP_042284806.1 oxysterol-binding protein-related protein 1-like isoform X3 [Thunnus maccoyii]XP_042284807.1 oxysterol-binding protein-related protein 1-like isoform X3 [Thunnus maccoyii]XP_042284808.1 oxysterol-binding protein-related protein 1-like isoform X3 [Thunnus maccoyii]XP_042284809.1 oxysterol-binding protein-related protein 1-like isoform X3 [Thunnus maccoyii]